MTKFLFVSILWLTAFVSKAQLIDYNQLDTAKVFRSLDEAMKKPLMVYRLDLTRNKLQEFPEEIFELINLNELILDKNKLDSIPPAIAKLSFLQKISLYRNNLTNFNSLTGCSNLVYLDLTANYLEAIPDDIDRLENLQTLILQLNSILDFPESLKFLTNLKEFNLVDNDLNSDQQQYIRSLFDSLKVEMSEPCNCNQE